ncbi:MAG: hypothetical protein IPF64_03835 [Flavobacteriales bacterium]|nr:hypothetical protein [Flavobacteriales bacterium]
MRTLLLVCSILPALLYAQDRFPTIQGETANGTSVTIPRTGDGPWTVVGLAYSQKATPLLEVWYEPAYLRFVAKHGLFASAYEAEVYFVPLFVGVNKAAYEPSMKKFRKSAEPAIVDHVVFSKDDLEPLQNALDLKKKDIPYFFVLDAQGRIVHREDGAFTDEKLEAIEAIMLE